MVQQAIVICNEALFDERGERFGGLDVLLVTLLVTFELLLLDGREAGAKKRRGLARARARFRPALPPTFSAYSASCARSHASHSELQRACAAFTCSLVKGKLRRPPRPAI